MSPKPPRSRRLIAASSATVLIGAGIVAGPLVVPAFAADCTLAPITTSTTCEIVGPGPVGSTALYQVTVFGAGGGGSQVALTNGGAGARIIANISLQAGSTIDVVVATGGASIPGGSDFAMPGGGGSTAILQGSTLLVEAGGGGGSGVNNGGSGAADGTAAGGNAENSCNSTPGAGGAPGTGAGGVGAPIPGCASDNESNEIGLDGDSAADGGAGADGINGTPGADPGTGGGGAGGTGHSAGGSGGSQDGGAISGGAGGGGGYGGGGSSGRSTTFQSGGGAGGSYVNDQYASGTTSYAAAAGAAGSGEPGSRGSPTVNGGDGLVSFQLLDAPIVQTEASAPTGVTATGATVHSTVNAQRALATPTIEYSTNPTLSSGVQTASLSPADTSSDNDNPVPFTGTITGLTGSTTYYYRTSATNAHGTTLGEIESFTTSAAPNPGAQRPGVPPNLRVVGKPSGNRFIVAWNKSARATTATRYIVRVNRVGNPRVILTKRTKKLKVALTRQELLRATFRSRGDVRGPLVYRVHVSAQTGALESRPATTLLRLAR